MAKKKKEKPKMKETIPLSLEEDIKKIDIPFDLFTGFYLVVGELKSKGYIYSELIEEPTPTLIFLSKELEEKITLNITKENLLIKQLSDLNGKEKLKVIYVVKDSGRNFKLI